MKKRKRKLLSLWKSNLNASSPKLVMLMLSYDLLLLLLLLQTDSQAQSSGTLAKSGAAHPDRQTDSQKEREDQCRIPSSSSFSLPSFYWWYRFFTASFFSGDRSTRHGTVQNATRHKCVRAPRLHLSVCLFNVARVGVDAVDALGGLSTTTTTSGTRSTGGWRLLLSPTVVLSAQHTLN